MKIRLLAPMALTVAFAGCSTHRPPRVGPSGRDGWRAVHLLDRGTDAELDLLAGDVPALAGQGINVIVLEESYPSIPLFLGKGFRVLPTSYDKPDAALALIDYAAEQKSPRMLGHLFTTWSRPKDLARYPPLVEDLKRLAPPPR